MKKLLLFTAALLSLSTASKATVYDVTTGAEFKTVFAKIGLTDESKDTVYIHASTEGCCPGNITCSGQGKNYFANYQYDTDAEGNPTEYYFYWDAMANPNAAPHRGNIWFIGINDEAGNQAKLQTSWYYQSFDTVYNMSLIFDNLIIQDANQGKTEKSYLIRGDRDTQYFDSIIFRNCDFNSIGDFLFTFKPVQVKKYYYTPEPGKVYDTQNYPTASRNESVYPSGGEIGLFMMDNCKWHNGKLNNTKLYDGAHHFSEIDILNCSFYNVPNFSSLFTVNYLTTRFSENTSVYFENNNWYIANGVASTLFNAVYNDKYMWGPQSEFHFKNNIFMYPDWTDDYNVALQTFTVDGVTYPYKLTFVNAYEALGSFQYNAYDSLKAVRFNKYVDRSYGDKDDPNYGKWISCEVGNNYTPEEVGVSFNTMLNAQDGSFQMLNTIKAATAGEDGAALGNPSWYVSKLPAKVNFSAVLEGTEIAELSVTPVRSNYYEDDVITLYVNTHNLSTFKGWSDGNTDNPRVITLGTTDVNLVGTCEDASYLAIFNLDEYATKGYKNNTTLTGDTLGLKPAYSKIPAYISYMESDDMTHVASYAKNAADSTKIDTTYYMEMRSGKCDDKRPCYVIKTSVDDYLAGKGRHFVIAINTLGQTGITFSALAGTDGFCSKKVLVDYSLDCKTWTNIGSGSIDDIQTWYDVKATLPAAADNQQVVYIRVYGDPSATSTEVGGDRNFAYLDDAGRYQTIDESSAEFWFLTNIWIANSNGNAIETVNAAKTSNSKSFDLNGRISNKQNGLMIRNGRILFVK